MQISFLTVLITVLALMLMMVPGFIFGKLKLLPEKAAETCSSIVMYCCQTALVFDVFVTKQYNAQIGKNMIITFALTVAVHLIMYLIVSLIFRNKSDKNKIIKYASFFSNCGFMGIPFLQMLFKGHPASNDILIYAATVLIAFNVLNWTIGVFTVSGDKSTISLKKIVLNPVLIAIVFGFILFITVQKPIVEIAPVGTVGRDILEKVLASIQAFSNMVTPLSMFVIGLKLSGIKPKELFLDKGSYLVCVAKLIVMPLIAIILVAFLPIDTVIKYSVFLLLAMPSATSTTLFAVMFKKESDFSSVCVLLTTILSIITIPLMFLVMSGVFGVVI